KSSALTKATPRAPAVSEWSDLDDSGARARFRNRQKIAVRGAQNFSRLAFRASFYLNRSVSAAEDEVSSLTAVGSAAAGRHAAASFTTTHWSVVLEAQGETPAAQRALEILCRTYWRPIYGFVRQKAWGQRMRRISRKPFSRSCWSAKVWIRFAKKKGGCVRICWFRSKISSLMSEAVR